MFLILLGMFVLMTLLSIVGFIVAVVQRLRGVARVEQVRIVANDWGIRQIVGRCDREQPIAWHEVRAFYMADDIVHLHGSMLELENGTPQATAYTLATSERSISWPISDEASAEQRADSERLLASHLGPHSIESARCDWNADAA